MLLKFNSINCLLLRIKVIVKGLLNNNINMIEIKCNNSNSKSLNKK